MSWHYDTGQVARTIAIPEGMRLRVVLAYANAAAGCWVRIANHHQIWVPATKILQLSGDDFSDCILIAPITVDFSGRNDITGIIALPPDSWVVAWSDE